MTVIGHAERQTPFLKLFFNFRKTLFTEVSRLRDIVFGFFRQFADRADIRIFQTVRRTHRKFKLVYGCVEDFADMLVPFVAVVSAGNRTVVKVDKILKCSSAIFAASASASSGEIVPSVQISSTSLS